MRLLKSYKHYFECSIITLIFFLQQQDKSKFSQVYTAFMLTLDAEFGC